MLCKMGQNGLFGIHHENEEMADYCFFYNVHEELMSLSRDGHKAMLGVARFPRCFLSLLVVSCNLL